MLVIVINSHRHSQGGPEGHGTPNLKIDWYDFFEPDTDISAISWADTNISKIFKSRFLLHYQKYDVCYALPFFQKLKNQDI